MFTECEGGGRMGCPWVWWGNGGVWLGLGRVGRFKGWASGVSPGLPLESEAQEGCFILGFSLESPGQKVRLFGGKSPEWGAVSS